MSKRSGEQSRRVRLATSARRYDEIMAARDKQRLVHALRGAANRLEAQAKGEAAQARRRPVNCRTPSVTDHAVLRFLERVMGLDVHAIREQIARAIPLRAMPVDGGHDIVVRDGFQFLLTPNSIVSVLTTEMDGQRWLEQEETDCLGVIE